MTTPLNKVQQAKEASVADTTDALRLIAAVRDLDIYNGSTDSVRLKDRLDELCDAAEKSVAALQAEVAQVREAYENRTRDFYAQGDAYDAMRARAETAEAALAEARRDAERYRWWRQTMMDGTLVDPLTDDDCANTDTFDAAIDAAIDAALHQRKENAPTTPSTTGDAP